MLNKKCYLQGYNVVGAKKDFTLGIQRGSGKGNITITG